jgi:hypothetical protein
VAVHILGETFSEELKEENKLESLLNFLENKCHKMRRPNWLHQKLKKFTQGK